jgi:hypothetical protein
MFYPVSSYSRQRDDNASCQAGLVMYLMFSVILLLLWIDTLPDLYAYKLYEPGEITVVGVVIAASRNSTACCDLTCFDLCAIMEHEVVETYSWDVDTTRCAETGVVEYNKTVVMADFVNSTGISFDGYYSVCPFEPVGEVDRHRCTTIQTSPFVYERPSISSFLSPLIVWCILTSAWLFWMLFIYTS